jgi:alkanesulfonate monooxygenase SsuD/methylene tetrahydromethanopterin reductase-like flavin-dependent oxidoreductase (luciferase family)
MAERQRDQIIGSPVTVEAGLRDLQERTGADELMITTQAFFPKDRMRSFELVAGLADTPPVDSRLSTAGVPAG